MIDKQELLMDLNKHTLNQMQDMFKQRETIGDEKTISFVEDMFRLHKGKRRMIIYHIEPRDSIMITHNQRLLQVIETLQVEIKQLNLKVKQLESHDCYFY